MSVVFCKCAFEDLSLREDNCNFFLNTGSYEGMLTVETERHKMCMYLTLRNSSFLFSMVNLFNYLGEFMNTCSYKFMKAVHE